jgi:colanic acid/amylovoran biosynthesis glycosyltransferase
MRIAYLINQYPMVSHSFIRREILALERAGLEVTRVAVRGWDDLAADAAADVAEKVKTRYLLQGGMLPLLAATSMCALSRPLRFLAALFSALRFARGSLRPAPLHLVYLAEACLLQRWHRYATSVALVPKCACRWSQPACRSQRCSRQASAR